MFILASEKFVKVTPGKFTNIEMISIKTLSLYGFQVYVLIIDGATENDSFFEEMVIISIQTYFPSDLMKELKSISYNCKT